MLKRLAILILLLWPCACSGPAKPEETVKVPETRLTNPEAEIHGGELFRRYCAICHGVDGDGRGRRAADLTSSPQNFHDPVWAARTPPAKIFTTIRDGVAESSMPSFRALGETDRWDIVAYVVSLGKSS